MFLRSSPRVNSIVSFDNFARCSSLSSSCTLFASSTHCSLAFHQGTFCLPETSPQVLALCPQAYTDLLQFLLHQVCLLVQFLHLLHYCVALNRSMCHRHLHAVCGLQKTCFIKLNIMHIIATLFVTDLTPSARLFYY
ncbi:hypothetical protein NP493_185g04012 [Ridgeia piscesae]|uniref:Uncharacterized protein n=1 Tax=Ridgeia piscesae TaxID=27915 RepID=A0AAD9P2F8_RIDPI|nr:hypothetical protein NP493_185g04012 [Ridgeia piscesae]